MYDNIHNNLITPAIRSSSTLDEDIFYLEQGILDTKSFNEGYLAKPNPVSFVHKDENGNIKGVRYMHNIRTNIGTNQQYLMMFSAAQAPANWLMLSSVATAPSTNDNITTFAEIQTSGLGRIQSTPGYTNVTSIASTTNTGTTTFNYTFKNNGSGQVTVWRVGIADNSTPGAGNLYFETVASASVTLNISDTLSVTYRIDF